MRRRREAPWWELARDETAQALLVQFREEVIVVGDSDVIAIHIEWMEGSF